MPTTLGKKLLDLFTADHSYGYRMMEEFMPAKLRKEVRDLGFETFGVVENIGGGDMSLSVIWEFINPNSTTVYLRFNGYYSSYGDVELQSVSEVKPTQKVVQIFMEV